MAYTALSASFNEPHSKLALFFSHTSELGALHRLNCTRQPQQLDEAQGWFVGEYSCKEPRKLLKILGPDEGHRGEPRRILSRRSSAANALQNPSISSPNCCLDLQLWGLLFLTQRQRRTQTALKRCSNQCSASQANCYVDVGQVG